MKYILIISLLLFACRNIAISQVDTKEHKCPIGRVWVNGFSTTDYVIEEGCYTPAQRDTAFKDLARSMCENSSISTFTGGKKGTEGWVQQSFWIDSTQDCFTKYYHYINKKKVEVTAKEYYNGAGWKEYIDSIKINGTISREKN